MPYLSKASTYTCDLADCPSISDAIEVKWRCAQTADSAPSQPQDRLGNTILGEDAESQFDIEVEGWETDFDPEQEQQVGITTTIRCQGKIVDIHTISAPDWEALEALRAKLHRPMSPSV
jgi:hypothetical protein